MDMKLDLSLHYTYYINNSLSLVSVQVIGPPSIANINKHVTVFNFFFKIPLLSFHPVK